MIGLPPLLSGGELLAAISHACVSYNVVNWSLSQVSLQLSHGASPSISALSSASLIAGMMCGQLVFGGLGDVWGRKRALALSLSFCTLGALLSSVSSGATVYEQIMVWRFAIGIGAGGVYPLASSLARESAPAHRESTAVALVFSMQGVGYLCSPLTMLLLLAVAPSSSWPVLWRVHLALGAVPLVLLLLVVTASGGFASASKQTSSEELSPPRNASLGRSTGTESEDVQLFTAIRDKAYFLPFLGTALPWLGFDICFYGNTLAEPAVLESVFGQRETLLHVSWQDLLLKVVALPGYFAAVTLMGSLGPRRLQLRGLCSLTLLYTAMGLALPWLQQHPAVFLTFFASTFFASNIGPNSTTFVLPSLTFPQNVRSTFSGASAALGKLGALLGTLAFAPFSSSWGVEPVLVICGAISAISAVVTWALVSPRVGEGQTLSNMYKEQETAEGMAHEAAQESGDPEVDEEGIGDERPTAPLMQTHRQAHH